MAADLDPRSPLLRFLDSFFQDRSIKWMLGLGTLLLFGSSLRLVTSQWEQYSPVWKHLILVGYTMSVFAAGELCRGRLGLRRTAAVLQALTVVLMPVAFLAFDSFGQPQRTQAGWNAFSLAALLLSSLLTLFVSRHVFRHLLRGSQPTFLAAYLMLCLAGALLPRVPGDGRPWAAVVLWAVFAAGAVKVNRHVFWLTERYRLPRVFGFFPIALLGTQFLTLFGLFIARHIQLDWIGVGCVLAALPVLLTADAVAGVHQQRIESRRGDPWPWSIVLPFVTGLVLCAAGVCVSAVEWPRPAALVPAAALAAAAMGVTAQRTQHRVFVWAMLVLTLLAYRYSPLWFQEITEVVLQTGARAVREERLPLAFYGLTCLPLVAALTLTARQLGRRGNELFAESMRRFAVGLAALLLVLSLGHAKAIFPVGVVMTGMFAVQAAAFGNRHLLIPGILAAAFAALGFTPFIERVLGWPLPSEVPYAAVTMLAGVLFAIGPAIDRWSARFRRTGSDANAPPVPAAIPSVCQDWSLVLSLAVAGAWTVGFLGDAAAAPWMVGGPIVALLVAQTIRRPMPGLGETALVLPMLVLAVDASRAGVAVATVLAGVSAVLAVLWVMARVLEPKPQGQIGRAFLLPAARVGAVGLAFVLGSHTLPSLLCLIAPGTADFVARAGLFSWTAAVLSLGWAFDAAFRLRHPVLTLVGCVGVLGLSSAVLAGILDPQVAAEWYPALWATVSLAALPLAWRIRGPAAVLDEPGHGWRWPETPCLARDAVCLPIVCTAQVVLFAAAVGSLLVLTTPFRVAGVLGLVGMAWLARRHAAAESRALLPMLANWQALCLALQLLAPGLTVLPQLHPGAHGHAVLPVAALAALSLLAFELRTRRVLLASESDWNELHRVLLRFFTGAALAASLWPRLTDPAAVLSLPEMLLAGLAFGLLVIGELLAACRTREELRVWAAFAIAGIATGYFALFRVIDFGRGLSMFVVLATATAAWTAGVLAGRRPRLAVMARPLQDLGLLLPLASVGIGLYRHFAVANPAWLGVNSLGLLLAAGFYFARGLEGRDRRLLVLSAAILNVGLALFWNELELTDPQFFMIPLGLSILGLVELLKPQIGRELHDPLRYLGALVILVSPTFHIVGGSWTHLVSLMVASVCIAMLAIGLRVRALLYMGTAFLAADLAAMVVRGSLSHPNVLWIAGIGLGTAVIGLAAVCENHREVLLGRLRRLAAELDTWQ